MTIGLPMPEMLATGSGTGSLPKVTLSKGWTPTSRTSSFNSRR